jgi:hypothetical protein
VSNLRVSEDFAALCARTRAMLICRSPLDPPLEGKHIANALGCGIRRAQRALQAVRTGGISSAGGAVRIATRGRRS